MANMTRWDPFRELEGIQSRLNRIFGASMEGEAATLADWAPAVDVQENETEYVVKADLPEVKKDDVKVQFENGVLSIEGERKMEKEENGKKFHRIERGYGCFVRRFALPNEVDGAKVSAEFKDGVLNVHLPKTANKKTVTVKVA